MRRPTNSQPKPAIAAKNPITELRTGGFLTYLLSSPRLVTAVVGFSRLHVPQQLALRGSELLVAEHACRMQVGQLLELFHVDPGGRGGRWRCHRGLLLRRGDALVVGGLLLGLLLGFL